MSYPVVYKHYTGGRNNKTEDHLEYVKVLSEYGIQTEYDQLNIHDKRFEDEPCVLATELITSLNPPPTSLEYLICCYHNYPLTNKINAALYMKKNLGIDIPKSFSIADTGSIAPIFAIEWLYKTGSSGLVACIEQTFIGEDRKHCSYYDADALALLEITSNPRSLEIVAYDYSRFLLSQDNNSLFRANLVQATVHLNEKILGENGIKKEEATFIPHVWSHYYTESFRKSYKNSFISERTYNLSTADPFYSLAELHEKKVFTTNFLILNFADRKGLVGALLLRKTG